MGESAFGRGSAFSEGGVCIHWGLHPGEGSAKSNWADPPLQILWDMVNKRAVHILLECILVLSYRMSTTPVHID